MKVSLVTYLISPLADGDLEFGISSHGPRDLGARDAVCLAGEVDGVSDEDELLLGKRFDDGRLYHLHHEVSFCLVPRGLDQTIVGASGVL